MEIEITKTTSRKAIYIKNEETIVTARKIYLLMTSKNLNKHHKLY